jgi:hypothetical protein
VYRYMFVGVISVNINGWVRRSEVTFKSCHSLDLTQGKPYIILIYIFLLYVT